MDKNYDPIINLDYTLNSKKYKKTKAGKGLAAAYFLAVFVVIVIPMIYIKSTIEPVIYPRYTAFSGGVIVLLVLILSGKQAFSRLVYSIRHFFYLVFGVFILWSVFSLIHAVNPREGLTDIFKWILVLSLIVLSTEVFKTSFQSKTIFLKAIVISGAISFLIGISQYFNLAFLNEDPNALYEVMGLMAHKNQYSSSLFLLLPFLGIASIQFTKVWKKIAIITVIASSLMIVLLQTRAVWIAIFTAIVFILLSLFLLNRRNKIHILKDGLLKKMFWIGAVIVSLILILSIVKPDIYPVNKLVNRVQTIFDPAYASNEWRMEMWDATYNLAMDNKMYGVGAGAWKTSVYPYYGKFLPSVYKHWRNPHNDFLWVASEKGIPGLLLYLLIFSFILYSGIKRFFKMTELKSVLELLFLLAAVLGFMIISFFSFPSERMNHLIFISLITGYIFSITRNTIGEIQYRKRNLRIFSVIWIVILYLSFHFGIICLNSEIFIAKAQIAKEKGKWKQVKFWAEKGYSKYAPIEPKFSFPVVMYKGLAAFHSDKDYSKALKYFKLAYKQHPTQVAILNNIGSVYAQTGHYEKAAAYYGKTLEIFSHYEYGLLNLAKANYMKGDYNNAYYYILCCDPNSSSEEIFPLRTAIESKLN